MAGLRTIRHHTKRDAEVLSAILGHRPEVERPWQIDYNVPLKALECLIKQAKSTIVEEKLRALGYIR